MFINAPTDSLTLTDPWPRVDRDLLDRFAKAPAANIGDVFDRLLVMDGGIRPFTAATRLRGPGPPLLTRAGGHRSSPAPATPAPSTAPSTTPSPATSSSSPARATSAGP